MSPPKVVDPDRSIDQNHQDLVLRRRTGRNCGSEPPSLANLRALSAAINASRPKRTREVFSRTPVRLEALSSRSSSMFNVVLIHISMHYLYAYVNSSLLANLDRSNSFQLLRFRLHDLVQIPAMLGRKPETCAVSKKPGKPEGGTGRNTPSPIHQFVDTLIGNVDAVGQIALGNTHWLEEFLQ